MKSDIRGILMRCPVTALMVAANLILFLIVEVTGPSTNAAHMVEWGASYPSLILEDGEYYRLFTSMFLHFGMAHLLNNMLVLAVLGERLEPAIGHVRFLVIYLIGGLCGNLLSLAVAVKTGRYAVSAGASGAVFALMGAILAMLLKNRGHFADLSLRRMAVMIALSVYLGFVGGGVDNMAHLGGLATGFLLALLICPKDKSSRGSWQDDRTEQNRAAY